MAWGKLLLVTGASQALVQAIGFICGVLIVRTLSIEEYALYTIANTVLGMMTVLSDGGIASGVMSQGGQVWEDKEKLGKVIATGMKLRRTFALWSLAVSIPILYYLLLKQGASWVNATCIALSILPAFSCLTAFSVMEVAIRLHQQIGQLQRVQALSAATRLAASGVALVAFPVAWLTLAASGLAQILATAMIRCLFRRIAIDTLSEDKKVRKEILRVVKRVMPGAIYYTFSGQITVFLLSSFAATSSVAEFGSLSRLSAVMAIISSIISLLVIPRFSRLPPRSWLLVRRFVQVQLLVCMLSVTTVGLVWSRPDVALAVLGSNYSHLKYEVVLQSLNATIALAVGVSYTMGAARGIVFPPQYMLPLMIISQVALIPYFDFSEVRSAIEYSTLVQAITYFAHTSYILFHCGKKNGFAQSRN